MIFNLTLALQKEKKKTKKARVQTKEGSAEPPKIKGKMRIL
jgi:hypothetical protein